MAYAAAVQRSVVPCAYELTAHASIVLEARGIRLDWLERVLVSPERTEPDRADPELRHAIGRVAKHDDRYLRVIYIATGTPRRIVTAYFDRGSRSQQ